MGWKNVKEHYRIAHTVHVTTAGICIGSGYINDIIVIGPSGAVVKRYDGSNADLARYQAEFDADPATLLRLVEEPDQFSHSLPVYVYSEGEVVTKLCEAPGWPNVTHDGALMYNNQFSTDRQEVVLWAKESAQHAVEAYGERICRAEDDLLDLRNRLAKAKADLAQLSADSGPVELAV